MRFRLPIRQFCTKMLTASAFIASLISCKSTREREFSPAESSLIKSSDSIMRVLTINRKEDVAVLRGISTELSAEILLSDDYRKLSELMLATVTHLSQDGVGIAAPQVGLNRRVVAVQRFDKEPDSLGNYPFEVYANIRIVSASDTLAPGSEGCLSVPDRDGEVMRSQSIEIEYTDLEALKADNARDGKLPTVRESVTGFTAVIFQHEIDHLEGILYIDKLVQQ